MIIDGKINDYNDIIKMINGVFYKKFSDLLPKLYKDRETTANYHILIKDKNKISATLALVPNKLIVGDKKLSCGGIGMVAVSRSSRGKGYMDTLMRHAVNKGQSLNMDFIYLSGNRQRYERYGFIPSGSKLELLFYDFNASYIKKVDNYSFKIIESDFSNMSTLYDLYINQEVYFNRTYDDFYDTLISWQNVPYAVYLKGELKGYFVYNKKDKFIEEIVLSRDTNAVHCVCALIKDFSLKKLKVSLSTWSHNLKGDLIDFANSFSINYACNILVLNYKNVIETLLNNKLKSTNLPTCSLIVDIINVARYKIIIINNIATVDNTEEEADITFSECEANMAMFSAYGSFADIPAVFKSIFPLSLCMPSCDNV